MSGGLAEVQHAARHLAAEGLEAAEKWRADEHRVAEHRNPELGMKGRRKPEHFFRELLAERVRIVAGIGRRFAVER
jgi:hypothetical protein